VKFSIEDRTELLVKNLVSADKAPNFKFRNVRVNISASPRLIETQNGQIMALTSVNLITRFAKSINFDVKEKVERKIFVPASNANNFLPALGQLVAAIDPSIKVTNQNESKSDDLVVAIGSSELSSDFQIFINSDGWISELNNGKEIDYQSTNQNPIAAGVSSCLASAEVFKEILRRLGSQKPSVQKKVKELTFSSLDYTINKGDAPNPKLQGSMDIGRLCLVGAGAVGGGLVYALGYLSDSRGEITVIDFDRIDRSNLNRYLIATETNVGQAKPDVVAKFLSNTGIHVIPESTTYNQYSAIHPNSSFDTVVSTVDNNEARLQIQSDLPRLILHGATHENTFVISRLGFLEGACLACLFSERPKSYEEQISEDTGIPVQQVKQIIETNGKLTSDLVEQIVTGRGVDFKKLQASIGELFRDVYAKEICGTLRIDTENKSQHTQAATVSFVSAMPGFLLAGEILKERTSELRDYKLNNYFLMSMFSPDANEPFFREKNEHCFALCANPIMIRRYEEKWLSKNLSNS
jgi:molybdopterin/thiamine biosynthesis adenylyltransferase